MTIGISTDLWKALQILKEIRDATARGSAQIERPATFIRAMKDAENLLDEHRFLTDQRPRLLDDEHRREI